MQSMITWYRAHCKTQCSVCNTPALLKDIKEFKRLRRVLQVCPDCQKHPEKLLNILYSCDVCKNVFSDGSLVEFRGNLLCAKCANERSFYCPECHTRVSWIRKFVTQSTLEICKPCAVKFELHAVELSEKAKAVLEKCHREAITRHHEESSCHPQQHPPFRVCARCGRGIACGDKVYSDSSRNTYCEHCAQKSGLVNYYVQTSSVCSSCGKRFATHQLSEFGNSLLCRNCSDKLYPLCPICSKRIAPGHSFHSIYLVEYCNPCGKKFGLTRYTPPPEDTVKTKKKSYSGKRRKKSVSYQEPEAELISSPEDLEPELSYAQVLSMMQGGRKTSWSTMLSEPKPLPRQKPSFSTNNYYHPDFDDNEEDDFVLDGIGGLDGKHDI